MRLPVLVTLLLGVACGNESKVDAPTVAAASATSQATPPRDAGSSVDPHACNVFRGRTDAALGPNEKRKDPLSGTETPLLVLAADSPTNPSSTACVTALLHMGAAVDSPTKGGPWDGYTALIAASGRGNAPVVRLLLQHGANPNYVASPNGHTALMSGAVYPEVAEALLQAGAKADAVIASRPARRFRGLLVARRRRNPRLRPKGGPSLPADPRCLARSE